MSWSYRKSIRVGPLRVNLSKSGVGCSIGSTGFRVGRDAKGRAYRSISIPHTGIYKRDYYPQPESLPSAVQSAPALGGIQRRTPVSLKPLLRSPWLRYGAGSMLLYALIRALF